MAPSPSPVTDDDDRRHQATCDVNLYPGEPCNIDCLERPDEIAASWAWLDEQAAFRQ